MFPPLKVPIRRNWLLKQRKNKLHAAEDELEMELCLLKRLGFQQEMGGAVGGQGAIKVDPRTQHADVNRAPAHPESTATCVLATGLEHQDLSPDQGLGTFPAGQADSTLCIYIRSSVPTTTAQRFTGCWRCLFQLSLSAPRGRTCHLISCNLTT